MDWLTTSGADALRIVAIRLDGLRGLSKMSGCDVVISIAVGTIVARTLPDSSASLAEGGIALAAVFVLQRGVAMARRSGNAWFVDDTPAILMVGGRMLEEALTRTRVTADDIRGKLREANVMDMREVRVVVLEATGDVSVLHGADGAVLDARLLEGAAGAHDALDKLESVRSIGVRRPGPA